MDSINHDHTYSRKFERQKDSSEIQNSLNKKDNDRHRIIRKKCDIETDEDRIEYARRRTSNNKSCRISRIQRRSKLNVMTRKCIEYAELNKNLKVRESIIIEVINQLKKHLRPLIPDSNQQTN